MSTPESQRLARDEEPAWDDCKVAFGFDGDADELIDALEHGSIALPAGWELDEVDGAGARQVAVFRVDGMPRARDGANVRAVLDALAQVGA